MAVAGLVVNHGGGLPLVLPIAAAVVVAGGLFVLAGATPAALGLLADMSERFPTDRGAIMGLYSVFLAIGQIGGSLIGGVAAEWRGIDGLLVATSVLLLVALLPLAQLRRAGALRRRPGVARRRSDGAVTVTPTGRPGRPVPARPRRARRGRRAAPPRDRGRPRDPPRRRLSGRRGDRDERRPRRRRCRRLRDRRRRLLADLGRGGRPPDGAQRVRPRAGRGRRRRRSRARGSTTLPLRGRLSITVPGAVRSWGDAHARFGRLPRAALLAPGDRARAATASRPGTGSSRRSSRPLPAVAEALGRGSGFEHGLPAARPAWRPGELVRLPALAATLERLADVGFDDFYDGDIGGAPGARAGRGRLGDHGRRPRDPHARRGPSRSPPTTAASG